MDDGTRTHDDRDHNPGLYQLSYAHHGNTYRTLIPMIVDRESTIIGAPGRTRTCNRQLRRPMLYPIELRAQRILVQTVVYSLPPRWSSRSVKFVRWSGQTDSNRRPSAPKADALPDCAMPRIIANPGSPGCARRGHDNTTGPWTSQFNRQYFLTFSYSQPLVWFSHEKPIPNFDRFSVPSL